MERKALRESTGRLEWRMKELDRIIDEVMIRSWHGIMYQFFAQGHALGFSRWRSMNCDLVWMPLSVSRAVFTITGFVLYGNLRVLWRCSAEMEHVRAELSDNRQRLLELGMDHDACLAKIAATGTWVGPIALAYRGLLVFVLMTLVVMYAIYTGACGR